MSGLHDGRIRALYLIGENPAQTEPNAHHVEEGLGHLDFLVSQDLFLNETSTQHADVVFPASSFAEKDGTFTNTERRVNRVRKAVPCPGRGARGLADRRRPRQGARRRTGPSTRRRRTRGTSSPIWRRSGRASATTGSRRSGSSGRASTASIRERRTSTRRARRARTGRASSIPSSTSRRSSSRTRSTRSCSRPAARSTTTTRRR